MKITSLPLLYNFPQADDKAQQARRQGEQIQKD